MAFMAGVTKWLKEAKDKAKDLFSGTGGEDRLRGALAACCWVAAADGKYDPREIDSIVHAMKMEFPDVPEHKVMQILGELKAYFEFGVEYGISKFKGMISKLQGDKVAPTIPAICCAVGGADDDFDDDEKAVVREICKLLTIGNPRAPSGAQLTYDNG